MRRRAGLLGLTAVTGAAAAAVALSTASFAASSHSFHGSASLIVVEKGCGGPSPGHCSPQRGVQVRAIKINSPHKGAEASGSTNARGRIKFNLRPGRYRVLVNNGFRKGSKRVMLCPHKTARVRFRLDNGIP